MADVLDQRLRERLAALARQGLARALPTITDRHGVKYRLEGHEVVGLCSNDYLGFADHPSLAHLPPTPAGSTASRLVAGDMPVHRHLEASLAEHVGTDDAVLFPSGFQLNVGVLPALIAPHDSVFSDALNHASLIDGLRLTKSARNIVPHGSAPPLPEPGESTLRWWVTESVFSMDGDRIDTDALRRHLDANGCAYVDEAHGFGLFDGGLGLAAAAGLRPQVQVCTLGKALGCAGAFVAASAPVCEWVRTRARSFVFTTGTSPALAVRIGAAMDLLRGAFGDDARERLWNNVSSMGALLGEASAPSPIFPLLIGANDDAVRISAELLELGWHVQAIRPPTVPDGTARLRITVTAAHTSEQIEAFVRDLVAVLARHRIPMAVRRGTSWPAPPPAAKQAL